MATETVSLTLPTSSALSEKYIPTINFSMVCPGVYRSGYPTKKNHSFLRALRLRSILYLCPEEYAESSLKFFEENNINLLRFPTEGNKEPFNDISEPLMHRILSAICDTRNLPLLIHCNKGKHRTGTVVEALRLLQGWSLVSIFDEYKRFAGDKARVVDQQFAELYYPIVKLTPPFVPSWLTMTPRMMVVYSEHDLQEGEMLQLGQSFLTSAPSYPPAAPGFATTVTATGCGGGKVVSSKAQGSQQQVQQSPLSPVAGLAAGGPATTAAAAAHAPGMVTPVPGAASVAGGLVTPTAAAAGCCIANPLSAASAPVGGELLSAVAGSSSS